MVLGISFDSPERNKAFRDAQEFPYRLLSDVDGSVGDAYETRRAEGEPYREWPKRITYLIDPEGVIRKCYGVRDIPAHPAEVLADLNAASAS